MPKKNSKSKDRPSRSPKRSTKPKTSAPAPEQPEAKPEDYFTCETFKARMQMSVCAKRQAARTRNEQAYHGWCGSGRCEQGKQVLVQLGAWKPGVVRVELRRDWKSQQATRRKLKHAEWVASQRDQKD